MRMNPRSIRNKLMVACALVAAAVLATPAAMAHDGYRDHGDHSADVLGALVVGAVIGGVLVSASQHHDRYYDGGYYAAPAYPPQGYYDGYPAAYSYPSYPAYSYGDGGYYSSPSYGGSVNVGVVYSNHDGYRYNRDGRYYGGSSGYYHGNRGYGSGGYRGGDRGQYYSRRGH